MPLTINVGSRRLRVRTATQATPTTLINSAWRAANAATYGSSAANGPWVLDQANTYYSLTEDLAATATALVIAAGGVTLDLNGHTVTYNNASPLSVPNGGFESDAIGATTATGWDFSGAPASSFLIIANDGRMWGSNTLQWSFPFGSSPQSIKSSNITIPQANRVYTASVMLMTGTGSGASVGLDVFVYDSVTGLLVPNYGETRGDTGQADAGVCTFMPITTNPVYLVVTAISGSGSGTCVAVIDRAVVTRSMDYGLLATTASHSSLSFEGGYWVTGGTIPDGGANLPALVKSAYPGVSSPTITDSVGTGQIAQGSAGGAYCYAIRMGGTHGACVVSNVTTYTWGDDITPIYAPHDTYVTGDSRLIKNCRLNWPSSGAEITVRGNTQPSIQTVCACPVTVTGNTINNSPMIGIKATGAPAYTQTISNNTINARGTVTNCYAVYAGSYTHVTGNTVTLVAGGSGEGICISSSSVLTNIEVDHNTVTGGYVPTREYGVNNFARAFRMRTFVTAGLQNINIHDNTFIATTALGLMVEAHAARIDAITQGSGNLFFTNNLCRAVILGATDPGSTYKSKAICLDDAPNTAGTITFSGNTFESDTLGVQLCYADASGSSDLVNEIFINNTITKSALGQTSRSFVSYGIGYYTLTIGPGVGFYGTQFSGGATNNYAWGGTAQKDVDFGWVATTVVQDSGGGPIVGATVAFLDGGGSTLYSGTTDATGTVVLNVATTHMSGTTSPTTTTVGPVTLRVTASGHTTFTQSIGLTANTTYPVNMS